MYNESVKTRTLLPLLVCILAGCASSQVGYLRARTPSGEGYSDTKIQDGIYSVQFKGRSDTNVQRVSDFALLRSAELTLQGGDRYFTVLTEKNDSQRVTDSIPSEAPIGCVGRNCFTSFYTVWNTYTYSIPGIYFMIQTYKEKPSAQATVFDAQQVKDNIERQYNLVQKPAEIRKA